MEKNEFSRAFIRSTARECGVELPKEMEDALVQRHLDSRDAYATEQVRTALEANKPPEPVKVETTQEYLALKNQYDTLVREQTEKETHRAKEAAYREILKDAGVPEKRIAGILKVSKDTVDSLELDENGNAKDSDKLTEAAKSEWEDFIPTTIEKGAPTHNPPSNNGGQTMTRDQIMQIQDRAERRAAIAANMNLFERKGAEK